MAFFLLTLLETLIGRRFGNSMVLGIGGVAVILIGSLSLLVLQNDPGNGWGMAYLATACFIALALIAYMVITLLQDRQEDAVINGDDIPLVIPPIRQDPDARS